MLNKGILIISFIFFFSTIVISFVFASESEVLPKNVLRLRLGYLYAKAKDKYNSSGKKIELVPDIQSVVPPGTVTGDGKLVAQCASLILEYGFTDRLTGQILVPYYTDRYLKHNFGWQGAAVFKETVLNNMNQTYPDLRGEGIGDIVTGLQYRFLGENRNLNKPFPQYESAVALGVRWPTGEKNDPNNPDDFYTGDGQTDIGLWYFADAHLNKYLSLGMGIKYENQLKCDERNLGDYILTKWLISSFIKDFELSFVFNADFKTKDRVDGHKKEDSGTEFYSIGPRIKYYSFKTKIPYQLNFEYSYPIDGRNTYATEKYVFDIRIYYKF